MPTVERLEHTDQLPQVGPVVTKHTTDQARRTGVTGITGLTVPGGGTGPIVITGITGVTGKAVSPVTPVSPLVKKFHRKAAPMEHHM